LAPRGTRTAEAAEPTEGRSRAVSCGT